MAIRKIAHTKKSTKRPARNREEQPLPEGLVERAAERAGISIPPPLDPIVDAAERAERDRIVATIGPKLVRACDELSEEIASYRCLGTGGDFSNVVDALYSIWCARWELGLTPNEAAKAAEETEGTEPAKVAS